MFLSLSDPNWQYSWAKGGDIMDDVLGFLKVIATNVASLLICDWLKKFFKDDD